MSPLEILMLVFALIGALDRIFGNKLGLGKEFDRGFQLLGPMALSMIGMIVIAPALGVWLKPFFVGFYNLFGIDPSILPASIFANDMGGADLAKSIMIDGDIGMYNALVVSSLMGAVISFTIPFGAAIVNKTQHKEMFLGFLCGIIAIPFGCLVSGLVLGIGFIALLLNLLPLIILAIIIVFGLLFAPSVTVKIFQVFGFFMTAIITVGLALGIFTEISGIVVSEHF